MSKIADRKLTKSESAEVQGECQHGLELLGVADAKIKAKPAAIVELVDQYVDRWQVRLEKPKQRSKKGAVARADPLDTALALGVVWGEQIARKFRWEWAFVTEDGEGSYAVVAPDRSLVVYPMVFIKLCLENPTMDCTVMLSFNMLAAKSIPKQPARGYLDLMLGVRRIIPKR